jgi:cytoskeletal protein CcmA (bactofilin family)
MFTRSSPTDPRTPPAVPGARPANDGTPVRTPPPRPRPPAPEGGPRSVIGNDLKIIGQGLRIISQGTLQVDGEIEGDVGGAEVIIGERGRVSGTVAAERVIVRGTISGVIRGAAVTLQSSSHVEGDIHHVSLAIEQGAEFDGRCRRVADASQLTADLGA